MLAAGKLANYRSQRGAESYAQDHRDKLHRRLSDQREIAIYRRLFERIGKVDSVLDMPCGYGRLFEFLSERAAHVHQADVSPTMLELNARLHGDAAASYRECSALAVPCADREFDVVLSIRLNHHLEEQSVREQHLREIMRLADKWVIVSYFAANSLKNRIRQLRAPFNKKRPKNVLHPDDVRRVADSCGFEFVTSEALSWIGSGHVFALLRRK